MGTFEVLTQGDGGLFDVAAAAHLAEADVGHQRVAQTLASGEG